MKQAITRALGIEGPAAKLYYSLSSPMKESLMAEIKNIQFDTIELCSHDEVAFFPEFYSRPYRTLLHGLLAHGLNYRGMGSIFLFGDGSIDACQGNLTEYDDSCVQCVRMSQTFVEELNLPSVFLDDLDVDTTIRDEEIQNRIEDYAVSSTVNYFDVATVDYDDPTHVAKLEEFIETGQIAWGATRALDVRYEFDHVVTTGSPYLPRGIVLEYAKREGTPITASTDPKRGDGDGTIFGRMDGPLATYVSDAAYESIKRKGLSDERQEELKKFMKHRIDINDYVEFADRGYVPEWSDGRPVYSMYTHLPWDAALTDVSRTFEDQYEWVLDTIDWFERNDDKRLVVKVHPAERIRGTDESVTDIIDSRRDELPGNVMLLEAETSVDPYALIDASDVVLVYTSTVGLEAAYLGKPVVTAADALYAGKGFTHDPNTSEEYQQFLKMDPGTLVPDEETTSYAHRFCYNFFLERPIYIDLIKHPATTEHGRIVKDLESTDQLQPGGSDAIDDICRSIVENNSFFYTRDHG